MNDPNDLRDRSLTDLRDRIDRAARVLQQAAYMRGQSLWRRDMSQQQVAAASKAEHIAQRRFRETLDDAFRALREDMDAVPVEREVSV